METGRASEKLLQALSGRPAAGDGIYRRSAFNAWGDLTGEGREANTMPGGFDPGLPISFDPALPGEDFLAELNRFAAACVEVTQEQFFKKCFLPVVLLSFFTSIAAALIFNFIYMNIKRLLIRKKR